MPTEVPAEVNQSTIETGFRLVSNFGLPMLVVILAIYMVMKYGPRMAEAHMTFLDVSTKSQRTTSRIMRSMKNDLATRGQQLDQHRSALYEATFAFEKMAEGMPKEEEIKIHCGQIRMILQQPLAPIKT